MPLFVARWPDGTAWLVSAESMEDAADILDQGGDPGACEVHRYSGPVAFEFKLDETQGTLKAQIAPVDHGEAMQEEVIARAFPKVGKAINEATGEDFDSDTADFSAASSVELERPLHPSSKWEQAVERWLKR